MRRVLRRVPVIGWLALAFAVCVAGVAAFGGCMDVPSVADTIVDPVRTVQPMPR